MGVGLASVISFRRSVRYQGMTSSIHSRLNFSNALLSRITDFTPMWPIVIHRQWHFITNVFAHRGNVLAEPINAFVGNLGGSEGVRLVSQLPLIHAGGLHYRARNPFQHIDVQVHLYPGKAVLLALFGT